mgnify:CR=1 FL=1
MQPLTDIELILSCPDLSVKCNYRACSAVLCYSGLALILFSMMINRSLGLLSAECLLMIVVPRVHVVTLWEGGRENGGLQRGRRWGIVPTKTELASTKPSPAWLRSRTAGGEGREVEGGVALQVLPRPPLLLDLDPVRRLPQP